MKKKILLADDNKEFRRLLSILLSSKYDVKTAKNGDQALDIMQAGYKPDLILSDLMMPFANGKVLTEQVRSSGAFKGIPIIILSSIDKSNKKIELLSAGANDYLNKPFSPGELDIRISIALTKRSVSL